ncbi:MAG: hypothetical protein IPF75_05240 [Bacteroidetes bacterium]|nr:hypothetical protein [Bacteroidota bacterium]
MEDRLADEKKKRSESRSYSYQNTPPPVEESAPVAEESAPEAPAAEGEAPAEA